jgi:hypothetical protein
LTFVNLETGKVVNGPKNLHAIKLVGDYAIGTVVDESNFEERGTFLMNLAEGQSTRVSAYPASTSENDPESTAPFAGTLSLIMPDKNTALFVANEQLWRVDLSGSPAVKLSDLNGTDLSFGQRMMRMKLLETK